MSYPRRQLKTLKHNQSLKSQQGVVIVIALFVVALVATMAYLMMARLERDTRRTTLIVRDVQAELYAQGSVLWAIDTLRTNWAKQKPNQLVDRLPITSPRNEENGYAIQSVINDMQGRFNLNSLNDEKGQQGFRRLLKTLAPRLPDEQAAIIVRAAVDWIKPGGSQNEFSQYYLNLPTPYRAAHRPMSVSSELRLVKGMTPALYNALQPYIVALSATANINVQTASVPVLMTLDAKMTQDVAKTLVEQRKKSPIVSSEVLSKLEMIKNHQLDTIKVTYISDYFLVETTISLDKQHVVLYTLLERKQQGKEANMNVLWQSKGVSD